MATYTVYEPRLGGGSEPNPECLLFVRDGFVWSAFLFAPLWMLRHRLWLALLVYAAAAIVIALGASWFRLSPGTTALIAFLASLLIGFEASSLRRAALARRKWINVGIVVGDDLELAERRFFDAWTRRGAPSNSHMRAPASSAVASRVAAANDVIGLFPEPEGRRT